MDYLLDQLSQLGVGCFWESHYAGALCYADDLVLLAPSPLALRLPYTYHLTQDYVASTPVQFYLFFNGVSSIKIRWVNTWVDIKYNL